MGYESDARKGALTPRQEFELMQELFRDWVNDERIREAYEISQNPVIPDSCSCNFIQYGATEWGPSNALWSTIYYFQHRTYPPWNQSCGHWSQELTDYFDQQGFQHWKFEDVGIGIHAWVRATPVDPSGDIEYVNLDAWAFSGTSGFLVSYNSSGPINYSHYNTPPDDPSRNQW
jgi:hypothetical protein